MELLMKATGSLLCLVLVGAAAGWLLKHHRQEYTEDEQFLAWITALLPFAYGGYYAISAAIVGGVLLARLVICCHRQQGLRIYRNLPALGVVAVVLGYSVSVCWAVNRGMALYGIVKHVPLLCYMLLLMQTEAEKAGKAAQPGTMEHRNRSGRILTLLPFSGCTMVLLAVLLQFVPGFEESQVISGRLSGFFEYANTLALFLMLGIAVAALEQRTESEGRDGRENQKERVAQINRWKLTELVILTAGVFGTGSRIGFALLAAEFLLLCLMLRNRQQVLILAAIFFSGLMISQLLGRLSDLAALSRYTTSTEETSSFLTRLLYYKDALPVILRHPFGLGYWGYASQRKLFQHGVYSVVHVHNDLLQLLLDIGWIPTLLFAAGMLVSFFSRKTGGLQRLQMFLIAAYCMFEFHLAYLSIWLILLACLHLQDGPSRLLRLPKAYGKGCLVISGAILAMSLWLGTGEVLSVAGYREAAVALTPFYTPALSRLLNETEDTALREKYAEMLVKTDYCNAAAWQVLADAAWNAGNTDEALTMQERAVTCAPYKLEGYLRYFDILDELLQRYESTGNSAQADVCREKLLGIPDRIQTVLDTTDPLAWKIQHTPELTLPEAYQTRLEELKQEPGR